MPLMVTGEVLCAIGTGLMTTLDNNTKMAQWVTYMTIAGFGDGLALNMPYVAIQALLKRSELFLLPYIKRSNFKEVSKTSISAMVSRVSLFRVRTTEGLLTCRKGIATFASLAGG